MADSDGPKLTPHEIQEMFKAKQPSLEQMHGEWTTFMKTETGKWYFKRLDDMMNSELNFDDDASAENLHAKHNRAIGLRKAKNYIQMHLNNKGS